MATLVALQTTQVIQRQSLVEIPIPRIAQNQGSATEYFLGDALGSVRQMTSANAQITYVRAYDPYGVVTTTAGASQTPYGYTGEYWGDYNKLKKKARRNFRAPFACTVAFY